MSLVTGKTTTTTGSRRIDVSTSDLLRQLGVFSATALVISNMIGAGIFTTTGYLAGDLGKPWLVLVIWIVGAVIALAGALCYSELGINFPASGGEYVYLTRAYGPTWGFLTGWISFFAGFSAPIALAALAFSAYLGYFFPALQDRNAFFTAGSGDYVIRIGGAQLAAAALILVFTVLNFFGVGRIAKIQNVLTGAKLIIIGGFILLGVLAGTGSWSHLSQNAVRTSTASVPAQFAMSLFWIYLAYSGWNAATYVAEEIKRPERTLPIALALGTALVAAIYLVLNFVFIYAVPLERMKGETAVGKLAAKSLFTPETAAIFVFLFALSLMATVNAMVTIGPRVYYAMAKNGAFVSIAARVHPRWHTPVYAILFQGLLAALMTVTSFPTLVIYIAFLLNAFAALAVASLFVLRRKPGWQKLSVVSFAWPLVPLIFVVAAGWTIIYGITLKPMISSAALVTVAAGALVYRSRKSGVGRR